ncbi:hypothetical protein BDR04DRAFT_1152973 [Suillus decipiens]|nr:hypothetical protein BDR04DRAFT_1152973 [Suillus decipiens]
MVLSTVEKLWVSFSKLQRSTPKAFLQLIQEAAKMQTVLEATFLVVGLLAAGMLPLQLRPPCISRPLGDQSAQYAGSFINVLLENLQSNVLNRDVNISILLCLGEIALAANSHAHNGYK